MTLARTGRDSTRSPRRYRPPARDSFGLGAGAFYGGRFQVIGSTWGGVADGAGEAKNWSLNRHRWVAAVVIQLELGAQPQAISGRAQGLIAAGLAQDCF